MADDGQVVGAVFAPRGRGGLGEVTSGWLIGCQGNQQRGAPLTTSLINYPSGDSSELKVRIITSWRQRQVHMCLLIQFSSAVTKSCLTLCDPMTAAC